MPELRRDPIIGRWVIVSSDRGKRPTDFTIPQDSPQVGTCPFCPGFEDKTPPEILAYYHSGREKNKPGWWVRVIPNKYPALEIDLSFNRTGDGMYDRMNGMGAHEVIIETPNHDQKIYEMETAKLEDVFWAFRDRIMDLKKDPRLEYILIFKNHGSAAGASLSHPHSQLIAMPMVPIRSKQEYTGASHYYDYKERCVYCDIIRYEMQQDTRVVAKNKDYVVVAPYASRFPFEMWVLPLRHSSEFQDIQKTEITSLSTIMKEVYSKMDFVLNNPPFNFILHTAPLKTANLPYFHWYLEIIPKLTKVAGFEVGTGFYINPTPPEEAAKLLRDIQSYSLVNILFAASEAVPFCKTGGLADVVGALPPVLAKKKKTVAVVLPYYKTIREKFRNLRETAVEFHVPYGTGVERVQVLELVTHFHYRVYFLKHEGFFGRPGIYGETPGASYDDNQFRFGFFSRAVLEFCKHIHFRPDIIHCHDWPTGLLPAYLKLLYKDDPFFRNTASLFTIHNVAYQGNFPRESIAPLGLPEWAYQHEGFEFYGLFSFLKAGLFYADGLSTVSTTYAKEIMGSDEFGRGLEGLLSRRKKRFRGILNGIDEKLWNPKTDPYLAHHYDAESLQFRVRCKRDLQKSVGFIENERAPLLGFVGRLDFQKGIDTLVDLATMLAREGCQLIFLGVGDPFYRRMLEEIHSLFPANVFLETNFSEPLAHKIYAGADMFLMPSRYEPCGLGQMIAMRYGALPVVAPTGGLLDTVKPASKKGGTGFLAADRSPAAFYNAVREGLQLLKKPKAWAAIQKTA